MPLVPSANTEISRGSISITASVPGMMILQPQNRSHKNTTKTQKVCKAELCTLYPLSDTGKTMSLNHKKYEKSKQNNMFPLTFCKSPPPPKKKNTTTVGLFRLGEYFLLPAKLRSHPMIRYLQTQASCFGPWDGTGKRHIGNFKGYRVKPRK